MDATAANMTLPIAVVSPTDVARLHRELESLDEFFRQSEIRNGGELQGPPRYSRLMDQLVVENKLNLLQTNDRGRLLDFLQRLADKAPILHMSFSSDPPGPYVQKIVTWLRQHIDGSVLVRVGLQPNIGAGCVVRTTNKSFDFSLRKYFDEKHEYFIEKIHSAIQETPPAKQPTQTNEDAAPVPTEKVEQAQVSDVSVQAVQQQPEPTDGSQPEVVAAVQSEPQSQPEAPQPQSSSSTSEVAA